MAEDYDKKFAKIMLAFGKLKFAMMDTALMGEQFIRLGETQQRWIIEEVYDIKNKYEGVETLKKVMPSAVMVTIETYLKRNYSEELWINFMDFLNSYKFFDRTPILYGANLVKDDYIAFAKYVNQEIEKLLEKPRKVVHDYGNDPQWKKFYEENLTEMNILLEIQKRNAEDLKDMAMKRFKVEINLDEIMQVQKI